jgi:hypothetical protein
VQTPAAQLKAVRQKHNLLQGKKVEDIKHLSELIRNWNNISSRIAKVIGRPATPGHIAEFVASKIFDINLLDSAAHKTIDGYFGSGPLVGKSVNIKWSGKHEKLINLSKKEQPDYYLVLTGQESGPTSSKGKTRPWTIDFVFLFNSTELIPILQDRGVSIGTATSVRKSEWLSSEIFPEGRSRELEITDFQREMLSLFTSKMASA